MNNEKFKELCEPVYEEGNCFTSRPCLDGFRGVIDFENKRWMDCSGSYSNLPMIVLVLESPHKSEYDQETGAAIRPANGATGISINNNIIDLLWDAYNSPQITRSLPSVISLYIVEAVSYQCSNNEDPIDCEKRNDLFRMIWNDFGRVDFEQRMNQLNPIAVINACTCSDCNNSIEKYEKRLKRLSDPRAPMLTRSPQYMDALNVLVQISLDSVWGNDQNVDLLFSSHPSSSWFAKNGLHFRRNR